MLVNNLNGIKAILNKPSSWTSSDQQLWQLLKAADSVVKKYCKRDLELKSYTEFRDGTNTPDLVLYQYPVQSITGVWYDPTGSYGDGPNAFAPNTQLTLGTDFALVRDGQNGVSQSAILKRLGGSTITGGWPWYGEYTRGTLTATVPAVWWAGMQYGCYKIVYAAGYPAELVPADLQHAVNEVALTARRIAPLGGASLTQENLRDYQYSVTLPTLQSLPQLSEVRQILNSYKSYII
jgi:hypothetical protein